MAETPSRDGYWYLPAGEALEVLRTGRQVRRTEPKPPWLVVDQSLASVIVSRWPGELWRVRVVELGDMSNLVPDAGYWRARSIELVDEVPLGRLFGDLGSHVVSLINRIASLTLPQAEALAAHQHPNAGPSYSRAWHRWAVQTGHHETDSEYDWAGVLAAPRRGGPQSPINSGLLVIRGEVNRRAREVQGDAAFTLELDPDDGTTEQVLSATWSAALTSLLHAAIGLGGSPGAATESDREALTFAWRVVFS